MKFRVNLNIPTVPRNQIPALDQFVEETTREAARVWVRAAVEHIPVWSGASRATLQALASAVGEHIDIDVRSTAPDRISIGRLYSTGGIEKLSTANWRLTYETSLRYLIANETQQVAPRTHGLRGSLIEPTPWEFRAAGNRAVEAFLKTVSVPILGFQSKKV